MRRSRTSNASWNIIFALVLQVVTFIRGLILPQIIIPAYGSDVNGLVSSITQFMAYISLLEAGVGSVFRTSLYKPLKDEDMEAVSGIVNEQKRFYRKIGVAFVIYVVALCFIYPILAKTDIARPYVISCILILSISIFSEYFISLPYVSLLSADQKIRISYVVNILYIIVNIIVALLLVSVRADLRLIYLSMGIIGLAKPIFYTLYVKRHYSLSKNALPAKSALDQRWNGMVHHFAFFIHTNTDSTILTLFISTAMVSVYNVYSAIIMGVQGVIVAISNGIAAGMGDLLASNDRESIDRTVNAFELLQGGVTTVLYSITAIMLMSFIRIYTANMTDVNYIEPVFGILLIVAEAIYCFRCIYSTISINANKFKETQFGAILECVVNLVVSLVLVLVARMGLVGVAIGTAIAMLTRYVFEIVFLSRNVINRSVVKAVKMFLISAVIAVSSTLLGGYVLSFFTVENLIQWVLAAIPIGLIVVAVAACGYCLFYWKTIRMLFCRFFKKRG